MTERAHKSDEAPTSISQRVGKVADALPVDDPSIPVLTERLTLPPLDLDLDFRLPPAPLVDADATRVASREPRVEPRLAEPADEAVEEPLSETTRQPIEGQVGEQADERMDELIDELIGEFAPPVEQPEQPPAPEVAARDAEPQPAPAGPVTVTGAYPAPDMEPAMDAPRVPTSLLAAAVVGRTAMPAESPLEDHELTATDAWGPNRMETDLREMILLDLARRLPVEVEAIVRRYLERAIEEAVRRFAAETRIALAATMREMVDRAVKSELERLKSQRR